MKFLVKLKESFIEKELCVCRIVIRFIVVFLVEVRKGDVGMGEILMRNERFLVCVKFVKKILFILVG